MAALIALLICLLVVGVSSNRTGPPTAACTSLTPGHSSSTLNKNPVPYQISVSSTMYAPGADITVTIAQTSPEDEFRGFIIQARRKSGDMDVPIGTFKDPPANTQLLGCTPQDSTWAHSAANVKMSVTATWTGPSSDEGTLAFRATIVVQNSGGISTYYENIMSEDLTYNGTTGTTGTTVAPATWATAPGAPATNVSETEAPGMMTTADDDDDDDGAGMIRASLLLTMVTLLIIEVVTRRL